MSDSLGGGAAGSSLVPGAQCPPDPHLRPHFPRDPGGLKRGHGLDVVASAAAVVLSARHQPPVPDDPRHPGVQPRLPPSGLHRPQRHCARSGRPEDVGHDEGGGGADCGHDVHHHRECRQHWGPCFQHRHLPGLGPCSE